MKQHSRGHVLVRLISITALIITVCAASLVGGAQYIKQRNLTDVPSPPNEEFVVAYERGVESIFFYREDITSGKNGNHAWLWWMLQHAADLQQDERLQALVTEHVNKIKDGWGINYLWAVLFGIDGKFIDMEAGFMSASHYSKLTTYGVIGDPEMALDPMVAGQFKADFCSVNNEILNDKACLTHQLLGQYFIRENNHCPEGVDCSALIKDLQIQVQAELESNPLVDDTYLQRVLMLKLTGGADLIKPIWLQRVLDKQSPDNGWTLFDCLIRIGENVCISAGGYGKPAYQPIFITSGKSTFHATAQGLLIAALMIEN